MMENYLDCLPCLYKQAIDTARIAGAGDEQIKRIVDQTGLRLQALKLNTPHPQISLLIQDVIKQEMSNPDPFVKIREKTNSWALSLYPNLRKTVKKAKDPLLTALKIAITGNHFDTAPQMSPQLFNKIDQLLKGKADEMIPVHSRLFAYQAFRQALQKAGTVLYLADNAGELVFDRILIEEMKAQHAQQQIILAVRDQPILNDALHKDALQCELNSLAEIVSSGCKAPGLIPDLCAPAFLRILRAADLVISKGQGNYCGLAGWQHNEIFHLFNVKCAVMAAELGADQYDMILLKTGDTPDAEEAKGEAVLI